MIKVTHDNIKDIIRTMPKKFDGRVARARLYYNKDKGLVVLSEGREDFYKVPIQLKDFYNDDGKRKPIVQLDNYLYPRINKWLETIKEDIHRKESEEIDRKLITREPLSREEFAKLSDEQVRKLIDPLSWLRLEDIEYIESTAAVTFYAGQYINKYYVYNGISLEEQLDNFWLRGYAARHNIDWMLNIRFDSESGMFSMDVSSGSDEYDLYIAAEAILEHTRNYKK